MVGITAMDYEYYRNPNRIKNCDYTITRNANKINWKFLRVREN